MSAKLKIEHPLLTDLFVNEVTRLIRRRRLWNQHLLPERDMAAMFGVSRQTVRRGLKIMEGQGRISRVQGRGTLVLPEPRKRRVPPSPRVVVGALGSDNSDGYFGEIMAGMTQAAEKGEALLSYSTLGTPAGRQKFMAQVSAGHVDGVLILSWTDRVFIEELLRVWRGPTVLMDHYFEGLPVTGVIDDGEGGARQAMEHLFSLGHRRIAYVGLSRLELNPWRHAGYVGALKDAGLTVDPHLIALVQGGSEPAGGAAEQMLGLESPPTAFLVFEKGRAEGVRRAIESRGLTVGKDVALVEFWRKTPYRQGQPDVTCVQFDAHEIGRQAMKKLEDLMAGKGTPGELVKVPTELVVGQTSRPAQAAQG